MNRFLRAPPPRLVNEGTVRGIHQSDDAVVDRTRQVGGEVGEFVVLAEFRNFGRGHRSGRGFRESGSGWAGVGDEDPDEVVSLLARIAAGPAPPPAPAWRCRSRQ